MQEFQDFFFPKGLERFERENKTRHNPSAVENNDILRISGHSSINIKLKDNCSALVLAFSTLRTFLLAYMSGFYKENLEIDDMGIRNLSALNSRMTSSLMATLPKVISKQYIETIFFSVQKVC